MLNNFEQHECQPVVSSQVIVMRMIWLQVGLVELFSIPHDIKLILTIREETATRNNISNCMERVDCR